MRNFFYISNFLFAIHSNRVKLVNKSVIKARWSVLHVRISRTLRFFKSCKKIMSKTVTADMMGIRFRSFYSCTYNQMAKKIHRHAYLVNIKIIYNKEFARR